MDTLFGWPQVPTVTPLEALGLLAGVPLVVIALIFAVSKANAVLQASRRGPGPQPEDPVWMGGRALSIMGGAEDQAPDEIEAQRRELTTTPKTPALDAEAGGASARW
ncbi:hypothetical protein [Microlunatus antarcticus]|uniref:Uncharacterized protein n=1 Tax=Microlunatus antarcticus TaxID=53388 RepID=A0A7W5JTH1_9ACTN|nr:hypothetical protein [Microlunatus antarcticus]MBB3325930.1 hypothetical protein [Microlunatus antarcticus]